MKKILFISLLFLTSVALVAQPKQDDKTLWKESKKMAKQLTKEGWKPDSLDPLETLIFNYKKEAQSEDVKYEKLESTVNGQKSVKTTNRARQWALMNAKAEYASRAKMQLQGGFEGAPEEFYQKYEGLVSAKIQNELKPMVCLYRENSDGSLDYKIFFLVDNDAALKARLNAIEQIKLEAQIVGVNIDDVNKYIRENVTIIK